MEVERGHIKAFAEAIEDPNPLWNDENVARQKLSTGMMAPPTFLRLLGQNDYRSYPKIFHTIALLMEEVNGNTLSQSNPGIE